MVGTMERANGDGGMWSCGGGDRGLGPRVESRWCVSSRPMGMAIPSSSRPILVISCPPGFEPPFFPISSFLLFLLSFYGPSCSFLSLFGLPSLVTLFPCNTFRCPSLLNHGCRFPTLVYFFHWPVTFHLWPPM